MFLGRVAWETDAKFLENLMVYFSEHHCRVSLATIQFGKSFKCLLTFLIMSAENGESHQYLIAMKTGIMTF